MVLGAGTLDDDDNKPIIQLKKSVVEKPNQPITNEGRMPPSTKPKEIIVYRRMRYRSASKNEDIQKTKIDLQPLSPANKLMTPACVRVGEVLRGPDLTTGVDDASVPLLLNCSGMQPTSPGCANRDPNGDTLSSVMNDKQIEDQSRSGVACNDTSINMPQLPPPRLASIEAILFLFLLLYSPPMRTTKNATEGSSNSIKLIHQKANRVEARMNYGHLDRAPMGSARKERLCLLRGRQKTRIDTRQTRMATKPQVYGHQPVPNLHSFMSGPLVSALQPSLSELSNLNPGCGGSSSQQLSIGASGESLQQFAPTLFPGPGNNMNIPREKSLQINADRSIPLVIFWFEDELDALWLGVRRHGVGNWESIIKDPTLPFSPCKKPEDLSRRWSVERLKVFGDHQEPAKLPEGRLTDKVQPIVTGRAFGYLKRKHHSTEKNGLAESQNKRAEKQTLLLGGVVQLPSAGIPKTNDTGEGKECSSEGTISG